MKNKLNSLASSLCLGALGWVLLLGNAQAQTPQGQAAGASPATQKAPAECPALLQRSFPRLQDEAPQSMCQYAGLEALHNKYKDRGLVVLGFPTNDFGQQEPGSNKEIAAFCESTFNVKFPMFAKSVVKPGQPDVNPLFADLARATDSAPRWNFHKYLVGRDGKPVAAFGSMTAPDGDAITKAVERLL